MPWRIAQRDGEFCVVKETDGSTVACHATKEKALAQLRALYNSEPNLAGLDFEEQRIVACAAINMARSPFERIIGQRLADPRPLTDLEIGFLDARARDARNNLERDLAGRRWPIYAAGSVQRNRLKDLSKQLARIEQRLGDQLYSGAVTTMREALKRAGVKAIVRARTKTMRAALDREGLTPAMLAAIKVNADELLDRAFEAYGVDAKNWMMISAAKRRAIIEAMYDLDPNEIDDYGGEEARATTAKAVLIALLLAAARDALSSTSPEDVWEGVLPFGVIRTGMRVNDGWDPQPGPGGTIVAVKPARDATEQLLVQAADKARPTPDLDALARGDAVNVPTDLGGNEPTLVATYTWVHGFWGEPANEFGPHADLDGVEYTDEDRGFVLAADPGEWPYVPVYEPGDHDGCTCNETVEWLPVGQQDMGYAVYGD